jgi:hypothetical protein
MTSRTLEVLERHSEAKRLIQYQRPAVHGVRDVPAARPVEVVLLNLAGSQSRRTMSGYRMLSLRSAAERVRRCGEIIRRFQPRFLLGHSRGMFPDGGSRSWQCLDVRAQP